MKRMGMGMMAMVILLVGIMNIPIVGSAARLDTSRGISALKAMEKKDVATIEKKIDAIEQKEIQRALEAERKKAAEVEQKKVAEAVQQVVVEKVKGEKRSGDTIFANSLIMGDSITQGLTEFRYMSEALVLAGRGVELDEIDKEINTAINLNPAKIFLCYGMNDIKATRGDAKYFKNQYAKVIEKLQANLPETKIYINCILPVQPKVVDRMPVYGNLNQFNAAIQELCKEKGLTYIDNASLVEQSFYAKDGIHMNPKYYKYWIAHMAEVANL